ncbi:MAG TPA: hypothetical protein VMT32_07205 [Bryobacteraceae bacterium]|nr:hypothetical protein [Bryobacteraceae bacterium]
MRLELTARVVSSRPLVLDVLDGSGPEGDLTRNSCGLLVIALVDAKLRTVLSQLVFNQMVRARLLYGGNAEFPHEFILSDLETNLGARNNTGAIDRSGLLISYRGLVEYVNVYNDGGIYYQDPMSNGYGTQKLSRDEMAQLLKTFADNAFDTLPSGPPPMNIATDRYSLTLICSRFQHVSLSGIEAKLAPLLSRLEDLKVRATAKTFYLLLYKDMIKQTALPWPFPQVPLTQLVPGRTRGIKESEALKASVPEDFLSRLPLAYRTQSDPNGSVYCTDAGKMYGVTKPQCGLSRPHCNTFGDLTAFEIQHAEDLVARIHEDPKNPSAGTTLASAAGVFWPTDVSIKLSQVGREGQRISNPEYEKYWALYFELFKAGGSGSGVDLIEGSYLYRGVRVCRVDPQAPATRCVDPNAKTH